MKILTFSLFNTEKSPAKSRGLCLQSGEVVVSLIREIKVFDKTHIEVVFDFDDCYKECLNVIASQGHSVEVDSTGKLNIRLKEAV